MYYLKYCVLQGLAAVLLRTVLCLPVTGEGELSDIKSRDAPANAVPPPDFRINVVGSAVETFQQKEIYTSIIGLMASYSSGKQGQKFEDPINTFTWKDDARPLLPRIYVSNTKGARVKHAVWALQQLIQKLGDTGTYTGLDLRVYLGTEQILWCNIYRHATPPLEGQNAPIGSETIDPAAAVVNVARRSPQGAELEDRVNIRYESEYSKEAQKNDAKTMLTAISEAMAQMAPIDYVVDYVTIHTFDVSLLVWLASQKDPLEAPWVVNGLFSTTLWLYDHNGYRDCVTYMFKARDPHDLGTINLYKGELPDPPLLGQEVPGRDNPRAPGKRANTGLLGV